MAELDFSRIVTINADGDKTTSLVIGVFKGNVSITIWTRSNNAGPVVKIPLPRSALTHIKECLQKILTGSPGSKIGTSFTKWDNETKKSSPLGVLHVGRDDKAHICLAVQAPSFPSMKFTLKTPGSFDSSEPLTDVQRSELSARTLIDQLNTDIPVAIALTSEKREGIPQNNRNSSQNRDSGFSF